MSDHHQEASAAMTAALARLSQLQERQDLQSGGQSQIATAGSPLVRSSVSPGREAADAGQGAGANGSPRGFARSAFLVGGSAAMAAQDKQTLALPGLSGATGDILSHLSQTDPRPMPSALARRVFAQAISSLIAASDACEVLTKQLMDGTPACIAAGPARVCLA